MTPVGSFLNNSVAMPVKVEIPFVVLKNVVKKYIKLKKVSSMALQRIEMIIKHLEISKDNINKP